MKNKERTIKDEQQNIGIKRRNAQVLTASASQPAPEMQPSEREEALAMTLQLNLDLKKGARDRHVGDFSKDGKVIFHDNFRIDSSRSRKNFADGCIKALEHEIGRPLPPAEKKKIYEVTEKKCLDEISRMRAQSTINNQSVNPLKKPQIPLLKNVSLADVHWAREDIISSPYCGDVMEIALATALNAKRSEDGLLWQLVIGEPSTGKTETVMGVKQEPIVTFLDSLTDKAFITGFVDGNGNSPPDLLKDLDGKCLTIKDLAPLFSSREKIVKGVLGAMVSIYDGSYARQTGTRQRIEYEARFSFIGCITPQGIQNHQRYMREMGSRFLFYRVPPLTEHEEKEGMDRIMNDPIRKDKIEHYRLLCSSYLHQLVDSQLPAIIPTLDQKEMLQNTALLVSRGRAVGIGFSSDEGFQKEGPFRLLSQFKALAINLAHTHQRSVITAHEMELVRRVALSTIPPNRMSILALFQNPSNLTSTNGLTVTGCKNAGMAQTTAQELLDELVALEILRKDTSQKAHGYTPVPEFAEIVSWPVDPLDHIYDP